MPIRHRTLHHGRAFDWNINRLRQITVALWLASSVSLACAGTASTSRAKFEELPELRGLLITAVSANGKVVAGTGVRAGVYSQAFRWDGTPPVQLLSPPPGHCDTAVSAMSADGLTVLVETPQSKHERVYRWLPDGALQAITPHDKSHGASAINDDGTAIAGYVSVTDSPEDSVPFLWTKSGGYRLLPLHAGISSAEPAYFSSDGNFLHGMGSAPASEGSVSRPLIVHWKNGVPVQAPFVPLAWAYNWRAYLLPDEEMRMLDLHYPDAFTLPDDPMRMTWVSADSDVILGNGGWPKTHLIWTRANGLCRLSDWLRALGFDYPQDAHLEGLLTSRDGRTLFGSSSSAASDDTPWRVTAQQPLGQIKVSSAPYCGGTWP